MASLRGVLTGVTLLLAGCGDSGKSDDTAGDGSSGGGGSTGADTGGGSTGAPPTSSASAEETTDDPTGGAADVRPNWHEDIAPLVTKHCQSCHVAGGIAPFAMTTYAETEGFAALMAFDVMDGLMPPWHALETAECDPVFPYKHDARLTDAEKQLFQGWADAGAPEGDPAKAAPLPAPPSLDLADPTTTALSPATVAIEKVGNTTDFFHCLSIDPGNTESVYLDGVQVVPGNPGIVHHVLIYVDAAGESASWAGGVKHNCGGGSGVGGGQLIGGWVPGGLPMESPADVGTELPPGTRLILNVHYHATGAGAEEDKGTGLALRWKTTPPTWQTFFTLIGAPGVGQSLDGPLLIPAGEDEHVEEYQYVVGDQGMSFPDIVDVRVWTVLNHMHKVGVDMRVWVEDRDTGEESCLLHTPRWDFNWQRSYALDSPITGSFRVRAGDKVRVRCVYNNTKSNPGVLEMLAELGLTEPVDVSLGEATGDEMCLTGIGVAIKGL
ncbi:MAG: hypothetical protein JNL82_34735 [Myxococcales bacterium]|nr:hypothetical protein [Myxococcales bacterium]